VAIGAAATILFATRFGVPISTTHALTGALVGSGMVLAGPAAVSYATLGTGFVMPLLLSPLVSLSLAAAGYTILRRLRVALGVSEETCVCVGPSRELVLAETGARLETGGLRLSVCSTCEKPQGSELRIGSLPLLNGIHVLSAGAVGFARGLNDTPKIAALLALGSLGGFPSLALVGGAIAVGGLPPWWWWPRRWACRCRRPTSRAARCSALAPSQAKPAGARSAASWPPGW